MTIEQEIQNAIAARPMAQPDSLAIQAIDEALKGTVNQLDAVIKLLEDQKRQLLELNDAVQMQVVNAINAAHDVATFALEMSRGAQESINKVEVMFGQK